MRLAALGDINGADLAALEKHRAVLPGHAAHVILKDASVDLVGQHWSKVGKTDLWTIGGRAGRRKEKTQAELHQVSPLEVVPELQILIQIVRTKLDSRFAHLPRSCRKRRDVGIDQGDGYLWLFQAKLAGETQPG
jgi:hypothetical protein